MRVIQMHDPTELGQVLFRQKPMWLFGLGMWLFVPLIGGLSACFFWKCSIYEGVLALLAALGCAFVACNSQLMVFEWRERGLYQRTRWNSLILPFAEIRNITYSVGEQHVKGISIWTRQLILKADNKKLTLSENPIDPDSESYLTSLRDFVADRLGREISERIIQGETVQWMPALILTKSGLMYRQKRAPKNSEFTLLPYSKCTEFDVIKGYFTLYHPVNTEAHMISVLLPEKWRPQSKTILMEAAISGVDFYPSFAAFKMLVQMVTS